MFGRVLDTALLLTLTLASEETSTIAGAIEVIQRQKYQAILLATVYSNCSKE